MCAKYMAKIGLIETIISSAFIIVAVRSKLKIAEACSEEFCLRALTPPGEIDIKHLSPFFTPLFVVNAHPSLIPSINFIRSYCKHCKQQLGNCFLDAMDTPGKEILLHVLHSHQLHLCYYCMGYSCSLPFPRIHGFQPR